MHSLPGTQKLAIAVASVASSIENSATLLPMVKFKYPIVLWNSKYHYLSKIQILIWGHYRYDLNENSNYYKP